MKTHYLALALVIILGSLFAAPSLASADSVCVKAGDTCVVTNGLTGKCSTSLACVPPTTQTGVTNTGQTQTGVTNTGTVTKLINPLGTTCDSTNTNCLGNFLQKILDFVVRIGTIVVVLMVVYVGFLFVVARGDPAKITTARQALLWTVVGALILLGAKAIAMGITATVQALSTGN